jgi:hypothetical protein
MRQQNLWALCLFSRIGPARSWPRRGLWLLPNPSFDPRPGAGPPPPNRPPSCPSRAPVSARPQASHPEAISAARAGETLSATSIRAQNRLLATWWAPWRRCAGETDTQRGQWRQLRPRELAARTRFSSPSSRPRTSQRAVDRRNTCKQLGEAGSTTACRTPPSASQPSTLSDQEADSEGHPQGSRIVSSNSVQ